MKHTLTLLQRIDAMASARRTARIQTRYLIKEREAKRRLAKLRSINPLLKKWYGVDR